MKRLLLVALTLCTVLLLALASCVDESHVTEEQKAKMRQQQEQFTDVSQRYQQQQRDEMQHWQEQQQRESQQQEQQRQQQWQQEQQQHNDWMNKHGY